MDIKEFCDAGYLQEANRRFFHPLGLSLSTSDNGKGKRTIYVADYRQSSHELHLGIAQQLPRRQWRTCATAVAVSKAWDKRAGMRKKQLGFIIEPV